MKNIQFTRIDTPAIQVTLTCLITDESIKANLNEIEFRTLQLEFAQGLRPLHKATFPSGNEEGSINQFGCLSESLPLLTGNQDIQLEINRVNQTSEYWDRIIKGE